MARSRHERPDPSRDREQEPRAEAPAPPSVALLALQRAAGNRATAAHIARLRAPRLQRSITIGAGAVTPHVAFSRVSVLLDFTQMNATQLNDVDTILRSYDANNRVFIDERALMQAIQADIDVGVAPFQAALPATQQTVLMLPDFRRMAGDYHLPGGVQQDLALTILADAAELERVYAELARRVTTGAESAESIMKWFTGETRAFAVRVIQEGMNTLAHPPTAPFSMVMAGSGAREEMFPGSDLDLSPVTDVDQPGVVALFEFVQYVEKRLKATMDYLKIKLGLPHELGLGPDTGVFGFAKTPEALATKVVAMQNTGQDATEIYGSPGSAGLTKRFERERDAQGTQGHALGQLQALLIEFPSVDPTAVDEIDIKKGFLRFPTLVLRDLSQFFKIPATNSFDRARMLVGTGKLDDALGAGVLRALESISKIRLTLHVHYQTERDDAATDVGRGKPGAYVLSGQELRELADAQISLTAFRAAVTEFVKSGGKSGLKKGFFASIFG
jgi:hypothetical protein